MTPKRRTRQRARQLDERDGRPPSHPLPRLRSGWSRPDADDGTPTAATTTPARRTTYADAATRPQASPAPLTPVALLSPLQGTPSLRPRTSLRPLALPAWNPNWDDDSNVGGTEETKDDDSPIVDVTAEDVNPDGSDSPSLLSLPPLPPSPAPSLVDTTTTPHHHVTFADISKPPDDDDPMAALNRGISAHLSELDRQQRAIGNKYDAFRALLVEAQASFDAPAIERRVHSAIGAHTAPLSEIASCASCASIQ